MHKLKLRFLYLIILVLVFLRYKCSHVWAQCSCAWCFRRPTFREILPLCITSWTLCRPFGISGLPSTITPKKAKDRNTLAVWTTILTLWRIAFKLWRMISSDISVWLGCWSQCWWSCAQCCTHTWGRGINWNHHYSQYVHIKKITYCWITSFFIASCSLWRILWKCVCLDLTNL